ncbi:DUF5708 family protein [Streptomyces sp. LP05-1]|uniref:DUF5708 family protein n=1 Tax=Streptomyces pyxinae TaxID=2970734 RepID=A0ABT2CMH1_9ACTN|nr:DUF5708 family protein [Streptomyces sp. LP05-1]MCS0638600.1 DUF5708 family protein [Streptomyces sp. LP05-1]
MAPPAKHFAEGAAAFAIGLALRLCAADVHIPVFTLTKVGVVLMAIGGAEILYGVYRTVSARNGRAGP